MTVILTGLLALVCLLLVVWGTSRPGGMYQFPFLAGTVVAGWILPQVVGLINNPFLPAGALAKTVFMTVLCTGACYVGYVWRSRRRFAFDFDLDDSRLLRVGSLLTLVGGAFYVMLGRLPADELALTQFTGTSVAYLFFADNLSYGFAIALLLFFRRGSNLALALVLFGACFYLERIVFAGRRGDVVQVVLMVLLAVWFQRRWTLPLPAMLIALVAGSLVFNSIDQYRAIALDQNGQDWSRVKDIDFVKSMQSLAEEGGEEMTNVVYNIAAVDAEKNFDYGLFNWNTLVFNYVPAQIVGQDFKAFLTFELPDLASSRFGYSANVGATETGISDSFASFWYFGFIKFFVIAFLMAVVYRAAVAGNMTAQIAYMVILPDALHALTHHTQWFFSPWVHMAIFLLPALLVARRPRNVPAYLEA